uniref:DUF5615 domain-containing protein n=1 Tax=Candidatus Kentrum sp. LFY TaxID=2126342 RepID=A0A450V054_9GAMM|nr:MAG: hypothetical protein BECKLFY1418B_GA0070995_111315 [Candidatus Kentron sp. LFY]
MRVLFDQGTPIPLRHHLPGHRISTAYEMGWSSIENGELLRRAENHGFEVLVTTDANLKYQQNLANRRIAIVILGATSWPPTSRPRIQRVVPNILNAIDNARFEGYIEIQVPYIR